MASGDVSLGGSSYPLLVIFFLMHTFGATFSLVMLLTSMLSKRVNRNLPWLNLCLSWIIACVSFSFLLYTGQIGKSVPNHTICMLQASMVYAVPTLYAGATLSLAIQIWLNFQPESPRSKSFGIHSRAFLQKVALVAWPYFVPISLIVGVFAFSLQNPRLVALAPHGLYCGVKNSLPGKISAIYVACILVPTLIFEGLLISTLWKSWRHHQIRAAHGLSTIIRLTVFTLVGICSIGITLSYLSEGNLGRLPNVLESLPPVSFVIVFITQTDMVKALTFWRKEETPTGMGTTGSVESSMKFRSQTSTMMSSSEMSSQVLDSSGSSSLGAGQSPDTSDEDVEKYARMQPKEVPVAF